MRFALVWKQIGDLRALASGDVLSTKEHARERSGEQIGPHGFHRAPFGARLKRSI